ncbi:MAG: 2'-5' RNA ligase family protein [Chloroflexi bacterium]|nr:2'-5' RNA ligase family protein [Chloroflexota bacterium]MDA1219082.1 2'-5' RNA ligase family protein [Chloroflexota bacterium]
MSVRYGIELVPDPAYTARVYRARQLICGQYGAWAAEMHMLHLTLADYFQCTDQALSTLSTGLSGIAAAYHHRVARFPLLSRGVFTFPDTTGNLHLDFRVSENPSDRHQREINALHNDVTELLEQTEGVLPDPRFSGENYRPHITLMQFADLTPVVFESARVFARAVLKDLQVPHNTRAWQVVLVRFESDAAGEDWHDGSWAADLRWQILNSYLL